MQKKKQEACIKYLSKESVVASLIELRLYSFLIESTLLIYLKKAFNRILTISIL